VRSKTNVIIEQLYSTYTSYHNHIAGYIPRDKNQELALIAKGLLPPVPPMDFERWMHFKPYYDEVAAYKADLFLASLNPDGGNLAGFHGVAEEEYEAA
jgi:hypothetical protein